MTKKVLVRLDKKIITDFCKKHNLSLYKLAKTMNVNISALQHWQKGRTRVPAWVEKMFSLLEQTDFNKKHVEFTRIELHKLLDMMKEEDWRRIFESIFKTFPEEWPKILFWVDDKQEIKNVEIPYIADISEIDHILLIGLLSPIDIWKVLEDKVMTDSEGRYIAVKKKKIRNNKELADYYLSDCNWTSLRDRAIKELIDQVKFK